MKKENITIQSSTEEFSKIVKLTTELKNKIEKQINDINELYDKTIAELTKSFKEKIEKLIKQENDIKEKLQNEVTKVKEKLENFLTEAKNQINLSERINKGIKNFKEEKNIIKNLSYISNINKNKKKMNILLKEGMKSIKFWYSEEESNINYEEFYFNGGRFLKKIEKGNCEFDFGGKTQGRILFDIETGRVYYIDGYYSKEIHVYENYEDLKLKKNSNIINLPSEISVNYTVIHKGFFYYFKYRKNNLIKYDLKQNKILMNKTILPDADLNNQNQWGGENNINLISDNNTLYAIYASNNNNRRISIALIDEKSLNVIKTWNTDSLEKKQCGPIFMINDVLYHIKNYENENDSVIYSYDLKTEKSNQINIPFENKGGYDSSLTYYPHLNCLMTINNGKIYKYSVLLGD